FREWQIEACESLMEGNDNALVARTGHGKSVCFSLPSIMQAECSLTIMVMPTISLIQDQYRELIAAQIPTAAITG
ncbi:hypothetical protein DFS34DRAFT_561333, partial [Phlyctochytrium arcticum]